MPYCPARYRGASHELGTDETLLVPNKEAFAASPRNLRMDQEKLLRHGICFSDTLQTLKNCLQQDNMKP